MRKALLLLLAGLTVSLGIAGWGQSSGSSPTALLDGRVDVGQAPFRSGEEVVYDIHWKPLFLLPAFKAGEIRIVFHQDGQNGEPLKISAWAVSDGALTAAAGLDVRDYFESRVDPTDFRTLQFLHQLRRNQKKRDLSVDIDYLAHRAVIRETNVEGNVPREIRRETVADIPERLVDTLSVFYAGRLRRLEPGQEYQVDLSDFGKIKSVPVRVVEREEVTTQFGNYETLRVTTSGGFLPGGGDFRIWYSLDQSRIPVKFEADVKFGRVFGQLTRFSTPTYSRSRVRIQ